MVFVHYLVHIYNLLYSSIHCSESIISSVARVSKRTSRQGYSIYSIYSICVWWFTMLVIIKYITLLILLFSLCFVAIKDQVSLAICVGRSTVMLKPQDVQINIILFRPIKIIVGSVALPVDNTEIVVFIVVMINYAFKQNFTMKLD